MNNDTFLDVRCVWRSCPKRLPNSDLSGFKFPPRLIPELYMDNDDSQLGE